MDKLAHSEMITLLVAISVMLIAGRLLGELFRRLKQPMVIGEILAGVILGPTVLGMIDQDFFQALFPSKGSTAIALNGLVNISVILLLFIAGLEVDLSMVIEQGKQSLYISFSSIIIPFIIGFAFPWFYPDFFGITDEKFKLIYSLFLGTALSITALPVIARILMDTGLFKSKIGMLIIASAMVNDLIGWMIFSVVLSMLNNEVGPSGLFNTILLTLFFSIIMLTFGRILFNKTLPWINKKFAWPGGILSLSIAMCFLAASFTEYIGIHAIFGAFIFGIALGDSVHLTDRAKEIIHHFVNNIFAPLFFVSIGLKVNFAQNFDLMLTLVVLIIAIAGKLIGAGVGAKLAKYSWKDALAIGSGMNARGAMEIILGLLALEAGIIKERMFVALVIMALVTSIISGPMMKYFTRTFVKKIPDGLASLQGDQKEF